ncbi:MAG TPA: hypothetical protein VFE02_03775 [Candidatus Acidoferrales bacterium]|jgi:hypothetical protein|nr:hypothetical protein [Candidatus Acidoferrales bacterium]
MPVQTLNGAIGLFVVINFHESKPAWLAGKTITDQRDVGSGNSRLGEKCSELLFCSLKGQIANVKFLQRETPFGHG